MSFCCGVRRISGSRSTVPLISRGCPACVHGSAALVLTHDGRLVSSWKTHSWPFLDPCFPRPAGTLEAHPGAPLWPPQCPVSSSCWSVLPGALPCWRSSCVAPHWKLQYGTVLCSELIGPVRPCGNSWAVLPQLVPANCGGVVKTAWDTPGTGSLG